MPEHPAPSELAMKIAEQLLVLYYMSLVGTSVNRPLRADKIATDIDSAGLAALVERERKLREACEFARCHTSELEDAWLRGALESCDGRNAERSNRNVEVETELRAALEQP